MARILVIDDDADFGEFLQAELVEIGHLVDCFEEAERGLDALTVKAAWDVILLDHRMPRMTGIEFLARLRERGVGIPVVLMTGAHQDHTVIEAMNLGAFSYIIKPLESAAILADLCEEIDAAVTVCRPVPTVPLGPAGSRAPFEESAILGTSKPMLDVLKRIGRLARLDEPVLILGETGTGKDLVARAIHTHSPRKDRPFVAMNCAAFNDNLLDDELFGHEPGGFTGADKLRKGRFEHAHGGTLFLDEVGDMPLTLQVKLLRVLENREVVRIGSNEPIKVDARVISATHRDLKAAVREGHFRQDLYYRLEGMTIHLPPLRERREDIRLLAQSFLARFRAGSQGPELHPAALHKLESYDWPGNIRQLQKVLCRAVGSCRGARIMPEDLDLGETASSRAEPADGAAVAETALREVVRWAWGSGQERLAPLLQEKLERELLRFALAQPDANQVSLSRRLGMARNTLRDRLKRYGLNAPDLGEE